VKASLKLPVFYKNVQEDAPKEIPEDRPNFSPLQDDFRELQMLIEDPTVMPSEASSFDQPEERNHGSGLPLIALGIAISGTAAGSGVAGWWLARKRWYHKL